MKNIYFLMLMLLFAFHAKAQDISFSFFDAQTGKAIQAENIVLQNDTKTYVFDKNEIPIGKAWNKNINEGFYTVAITAPGYKTIINDLSLAKSDLHHRSFYLRNLNPPENISVNYVRSLHRQDGTVVVGYIVDENGLAVANANIVSNDGEQTTSNKEGYFNIFLTITDLQKGFAIKTLDITKSGFKKDSREKVVVYPYGDYIYKIILENGTGTNTTAMSDIIVENGIIMGRAKDQNQPYFEPVESKNANKQALNCNDIPNSITVGYSNINNPGTSCVTGCPSWITVDFETYVSESLDNEWLNLWNPLSGIENAYRAGAVAIRSFAGWRAVVAPRTSNYDITNNTNDQAYVPGTTTWSVAAQMATEGAVIKSSSTGNFISTNYAAETNNWPTGPCGNGFVQNSVGSNQCIADAVTAGYPQFGHPWNMGQWGSARWASGLDLAQNYSNNVGSSHGYGSKTWQWIVDHYYPSHSLFNCGTSCPATLNIAGIISAGGQISSQSIISTGTLNSGVNAIFESPSIELLPGFEGASGSVLDAKYGTCQ